jgi:hypothetical protein
MITIIYNDFNLWIIEFMDSRALESKIIWQNY